MQPKRRPVLGILAILALFYLFRFFTVYTVRSGECRPNEPVVNRTTVNFPPQTKPLVVMSYNIAGHDELYDSDHIAKIAAAINAVKPDIVGLQEVHRHTWQARFRDQLAELEQATGMHGWFGKSYVQGKGEFGNALLTRGEIVSASLHELPSVGEPRTVIESVVRIGGATITVYVTHLTTWGPLNRANRREQLQCLARHVRTSAYPYLLVGDFNAAPDTPEMLEFRRAGVGQLCGENLPVTNPAMRARIDYIFADHDWRYANARVMKIGPSDHWPIAADLFWKRGS